MQEVLFSDWGLMDYQQAWDRQEELLRNNVAIKALKRSLEAASTPAQPVLEATASTGFNSHPGYINDPGSTTHHLLFVEHPPVYTLGKSGKMEHVLIDEVERNARQIGFYQANRGGDITYHGPGQLVAYPILDLERFYTDIGRYLRNLEEVVILTLAEYGLHGDRSPGETGVWLEPDIKGRERKICAMGIRCSRWVTMHGLAFNINNDLSYFDYIVPCGIQNKQVTSLQKELGHAVPMEEVKEKMKRNFEQVFGVRLVAGY